MLNFEDFGTLTAHSYNVTYYKMYYPFKMVVLKS